MCYIWPGTVWPGLVLFGLVLFGLAWYCLVLSSHVLSGTVVIVGQVSHCRSCQSLSVRSVIVGHVMVSPGPRTWSSDCQDRALTDGFNEHSSTYLLFYGQLVKRAYLRVFTGIYGY